MVAHALESHDDASALTEPLSRAVGERERVLASVVALCESEQGPISEKAKALLEGVFLDLIRDAERDVRLRLADRLASAPWAPSGLINALALDDIEIARPVIAKSPVLKDYDLIYVLTVATLEHQIEVARRPHIGGDVVTALLDKADPEALTALCGNDTAEISPPDMERMVSLSRTIATMRAPLARHPRLTRELAQTLYAWVGQTLRKEIAGRFEVDEAALQAAVGEAVAQSLSGAPAPEPPTGGAYDDREMDKRLVAKLQAAGQLRAGFLLRALRQGKLHLFQVALACLANVKTEEVQAATLSDRPELLALACAGVGIDRSVFPTVLAFVRTLNRSRPTGGPDTVREISAAFALAERSQAVAAFRVGVAALEAHNLAV